jgi:hypothetical protein
MPLAPTVARVFALGANQKNQAMKTQRPRPPIVTIICAVVIVATPLIWEIGDGEV